MRKVLPTPLKPEHSRRAAFDAHHAIAWGVTVRTERERLARVMVFGPREAGNEQCLTRTSRACLCGSGSCTARCQGHAQISALASARGAVALKHVTFSTWGLALTGKCGRVRTSSVPPAVVSRDGVDIDPVTAIIDDAHGSNLTEVYVDDVASNRLSCARKDRPQAAGPTESVNTVRIAAARPAEPTPDLIAQPLLQFAPSGACLVAHFNARGRVNLPQAREHRRLLPALGHRR
jgi:hypothetical protein